MCAAEEKSAQAMMRAAQDDLPVVERPFAALAEKHGVGEEELLEALREWLDAGVVRRYGAIANHRKLGLECNAMVVWQVPPERVTGVGGMFAEDPDVTHCYERPPAPGFPYNLYTMIHERTEEDCRRKVEHLAQSAGVTGYEMLVSRREFKKASPTYSAPAADSGERKEDPRG